MSRPSRKRAANNRTVVLTAADRPRLRSRLLVAGEKYRGPPQGTFHGDCSLLAPILPASFVDLLVLDPPYNLNKSLGGHKFKKRPVDDYAAWLDGVIGPLKRLLKPTATVYVCGDWLTSASIFTVCSAHFVVRNRITWEREKGRGARRNWKNCSEDIWFCTVSDDYTFNARAVRLRRKVLAPYRNGDGSPRDWTSQKSEVRGQKSEVRFRDTHPSNLWTDISVPFWSMPENTDHPAQKSEKLLAKLILASTLPGDYVLDPFLGSGTTSVVAKKLGRRYLGMERAEEYCLLAERRLELADERQDIQGFGSGVFWERNSRAAGRR
jgi:site-specific DNA-methyltransferase (adenine-specific)